MFNDSDVLAAINADRFPDGQEVALEPIFGNSVAFDETGNVVGARAMMQVNGVFMGPSHRKVFALKCASRFGDGMATA